MPHHLSALFTPLLLASPSWLVAPSFQSPFCLPPWPLCCWHYLPALSPPTLCCLSALLPPPMLASLPALSHPPLVESPACLLSPSTVSGTCLPCHPLHYWIHLFAPRPLLSVACLTRRPLCCRHHLPERSPPTFIRLTASLPLCCLRHLPASLLPSFGHLPVLSPLLLLAPPYFIIYSPAVDVTCKPLQEFLVLI